MFLLLLLPQVSGTVTSAQGDWGDILGSPNQKSYYLGLLLDPSSHKIQAIPAYDEEKTKFNHDFREAKYSHLVFNQSSKGSSNHKVSTAGVKFSTSTTPLNLNGLKLGSADDVSNSEKEPDMKNTVKNWLGGNNFSGMYYSKWSDATDIGYLAFTFPGNPVGISQKGGVASGTQTDLDKANRIANGVVNDFNAAISMVYSQAQHDPSGKNSGDNAYFTTDGAQGLTNTQMAYLALKTASLPKPVFNSAPKSVTAEGNMYVTAANGDRLLYGQAKGYHDADDFSATSKNKGSNGVITWPMIALNAVANWAVSDVTYTQAQKVTNDDKFSQAVTSFLSGFVNTLISVLGIVPLTDLIFNAGSRTRDAGVYNGIARISWFQATNVVLVLFEMLAVFVIAFALAKMLWEAQRQTLNMNEKLNLWSNIKNLAITLGLLMIYPEIFQLLTWLNFTLVKVLLENTGSGQVANIWAQFTGMGGSAAIATIAGVIISIVYLFLNIYFFFFYTFRAIFIMVLNAVAPLYISSIALGEQYVPTFITWFKELIGNIFVQSFQAIVLMIFTTISLKGGGLKPLEMIFLVCALIPMSSWFKQSLQIQGKFTDELTQGALGSSLALGTAAVSGMRSMGNNNDDYRPNNNYVGDDHNQAEPPADAGVIPDNVATSSNTLAAPAVFKPRSQPGASTETNGSPLGRGIPKAMGVMAIGAAGGLAKAGVTLGANAVQMKHPQRLVNEIGRVQNGAQQWWRRRTDQFADNLGAKHPQQDPLSQFKEANVKSGIQAGFLHKPIMQKQSSGQRAIPTKDQMEAKLAQSALTSDRQIGGVNPLHNQINTDEQQRVVGVEQHFDSQPFRQQTGIEAIKDDTPAATRIDNRTHARKPNMMDAIMDFDFNKGQFKDDRLTNSGYGQDMANVARAFKNHDRKGVALAQANGIQNMRSLGKGKTAVTLDKSKVGVEHIQRAGSGTQFTVTRTPAQYSESNMLKGALANTSAQSRHLSSRAGTSSVDPAFTATNGYRQDHQSAVSGQADFSQVEAFKQRVGNPATMSDDEIIQNVKQMDSNLDYVQNPVYDPYSSTQDNLEPGDFTTQDVEFDNIMKEFNQNDDAQFTQQKQAEAATFDSESDNFKNPKS